MFSKPSFLLPALALFAVACATPQQAPLPAGGQGATAPKYGGVLNVPVSNDPTNWDMTISKSVPNSVGAAMLYGTLLTYKVGPDIDYNQGVLAPKLAERWEVSNDASTFTFHLRRGVRFTDAPPLNGRELTSTDVKWSYEYGSRSGEFKDKQLGPSEYDFMFEGVDRIETPGPYTVAVHFKNPFAPFIQYAGADWNVVMARRSPSWRGASRTTYSASGHTGWTSRRRRRAPAGSSRRRSTTGKTESPTWARCAGL